MKDTIRQISVCISVLSTIVMNILANALPLNGLNTGVISDRFKVYFVPAGYVFSIWGLIYIGLIAYAIYQALPAQRENPRLQKIGWLAPLSGLVNITWLFFWHFERFPLTLIAMLVLLGLLIAIYLQLGMGKTRVSRGETWSVRIPFSVYLGWITVATVANVTDVLDYLKWNGLGIAPQTWFMIILAVVLVIAALVSLSRRDLAYGLVIVWALVGIYVKQSATPLVATSALIGAGLVALVIGYSQLQPGKA